MPETKSSTLDGVSETLLIPLYYRALETQHPDAMIKDEKAMELIKRLSSESPIRYDSDCSSRPRCLRRTGYCESCSPAKWITTLGISSNAILELELS